MGLWESAEYYRDKWYKHQKPAKETITPEEQSVTSESDWAPAPETEEERRRREWDKVWEDALSSQMISIFHLGSWIRRLETSHLVTEKFLVQPFLSAQIARNQPLLSPNLETTN